LSRAACAPIGGRSGKPQLQWREQQLAEWDKLDAKNKLALL